MTLLNQHGWIDLFISTFGKLLIAFHLLLWLQISWIRTLTIWNLITSPHIWLLPIILNTKTSKSWISFLQLTILRLGSYKRQVMLITKLIRMFNTKLSTLSWSINHLRVVIVSLGVNLLTAGQSFRKDTSLLLVDNFLLTDCWNELTGGLSLFETF